MIKVHWDLKGSTTLFGKGEPESKSFALVPRPARLRGFNTSFLDTSRETNLETSFRDWLLPPSYKYFYLTNLVNNSANKSHISG